MQHQCNAQILILDEFDSLEDDGIDDVFSDTPLFEEETELENTNHIVI